MICIQHSLVITYLGEKRVLVGVIQIHFVFAI